MNDDSKHDKDLKESEEESPEIYSIAGSDDQPKFSRRSFLEIAAMAAGTAAISPLISRPAAAAGSKHSQIRAHDCSVTALAVNSQGTLLASGDQKGSLKLWELPDGGLLHSWKGHKASVSSISFPQNDDTIWTLDAKGRMKQWRLPDGKEREYGKFSRSSLSGNSLISVPKGADWYATARNEPYVSQVQRKLSELGFDPGAVDGVFGGRTKTAISKYQQSSQIPVTGAIDQETLSKLGINKSSGIMELRSKVSGKKLLTLKDWAENTSALVVTEDGTFLMAGGMDGKLALWVDPASDPSPVKVATGKGAISALSIAPKGVIALSAHADGQLTLWKLSELQQGESSLSGNGEAIQPGCQAPA